MSSPRVGPRRATPLGPLANEADEGVLLCEFVVRMRLKNRVVQDALTTDLARPSRESWISFVRVDLRRLARESAEKARHAALLRNSVAGSDGLGRSIHDYRHLDAGHLDRRYLVGKVVARRLRRRSRDRDHVALLVQQACLDAEHEIDQAVRVRDLSVADAQLIVERIRRLRRVGGEVGPIRLKTAGSPEAS